MYALVNKDSNVRFVPEPPIRIYVKDPEDGGSVLRDTSRDMMFEWCDENCTSGYWIGMGYGHFESNADAVLFKLRWA